VTVSAFDEVVHAERGWFGSDDFTFTYILAWVLTTVSVTGINQVSINKMWFTLNIFEVGHQKILVKGHAVHVP